MFRQGFTNCYIWKTTINLSVRPPVRLSDCFFVHSSEMSIGMWRADSRHSKLIIRSSRFMIQSTILNPRFNPRFMIQSTIQLLPVPKSAHGYLFGSRFEIHDLVHVSRYSPRLKFYKFPIYVVHGLLLSPPVGIHDSVHASKSFFSPWLFIRSTIRNFVSQFTIPESVHCFLILSTNVASSLSSPRITIQSTIRNPRCSPRFTIQSHGKDCLTVLV